MRRQNVPSLRPWKSITQSVVPALVLGIAALVAAAVAHADEGSERKPCKSIRPGLWKGLHMMMAEGDDEKHANDGPSVPSRSDSERLARVARFWSGGVSDPGKNSAGFETCIRSADAQHMVVIPSGSFTMGMPSSLHGQVATHWVEDMASPAHQVTLSAFAIDATEVTWVQYRKYQKGVLDRKQPRQQEWAGDDHPVNGVTWFEAAGYCDWVGARLPTEAEWEYAARGSANLVYPWGDQFPPPAGVGNFLDASRRAALCDPSLPVELDDGYIWTAPVGSFPDGASPFGILDMAGNVSEWTDDWLGTGYTSDSVTNPRGTRHAGVRGSSYLNEMYTERRWQSFDRSLGEPPWYRGDRDIGFRCAQDVPAGRPSP